MELTAYVDTVRQGIANAAALADEHTRAVAERLGSAVDSSTRLALIQALSDAASSISADLAPISVELRMSGTDPQLVVSVPPTGSEPTVLRPESPPEPAESPADDTDEPLARITLRLPSSVKARVDELAAKEGISTNAWLIRAVTDALGERFGGFPPPSPTTAGFAGIFGQHGPFGPHGLFGPNGPFNDARPTPPHLDAESGAAQGHRAQGHRVRAHGNAVQGWVR